MVGDADQSIYAFRGATIRNIEEFERDYPDARTILLEQNYRSTQNILSAANSVISRNTGRREKRLWTESGEGELITGYVADNEHDEASVRRVRDRQARSIRGDAKFGDVAVFYRTNNSSRALEEIFIRLGVPYKVVGGVRFYERKEVRDIVAYLRVAREPGRHRQPAPDPQHTPPRHRRPRRGVRGGARRAAGHRLRARRCGTAVRAWSRC